MSERQAKASHGTMHPTWSAELAIRAQTHPSKWNKTPAGVATAKGHSDRSRKPKNSAR